MKQSIEFKDNGDFVEFWYEDDRPPFADRLGGTLRKDDEGYYRFHPARKIVLTCRHTRNITAALARLNGASKVSVDKYLSQAEEAETMKQRHLFGSFQDAIKAGLRGELKPGDVFNIEDKQ